MNAFLALDRPLPTDLALAGLTPDPWSPWDCNAVFLVRHVVFANWQKKLWRARVAEALGTVAAIRLESDDRTVPLVVPPGETAPAFRLDPAWYEPVRWATAMLRASDPDLFGALGDPRLGIGRAMSRTTSTRRRRPRGRRRGQQLVGARGASHRLGVTAARG